MSYLSMSNVYVKTHNRFLTEAQPRNLLLPDNKTTQITENNNQISLNDADKTIQAVWSKYTFGTNNVKTAVETVSNNLNEDVKKMSWAEVVMVKTPEKVEEDVEENSKMEEETEVQPVATPEREESSPSHHARRPMNAFLIFCKKHRPIVRQKYPNLENRGVTRILGEWWALLDESDKSPYTGLAKEYKDAFLSANPNFKWYKLPAPPLRTLNVRPTSTYKVHSPISSPNHSLAMESEFTPGKLADESQLGGLTSLMNNNFMSSKIQEPKIQETPPEDNNNVETTEEVYNSYLRSPVNFIQTSLPPKPIKKRIVFETNLSDNNKSVVRNLLKNDISDSETSKADPEPQVGEVLNGNNLTNQDLMNKVVENIFTKTESDYYSDQASPKEVRKSDRQCKGKRYEKFMVEGRLLGNKRDTKLTSQKISETDRIENELSAKLETKPETETPNLNHTIKRLAERTNMKNLLETETSKSERVRSISETSDSSEVGSKNPQVADFNLDLRISKLSSLSYEVFSQRKKESKKRKNRIRTGDSESKAKVMKMTAKETQLVGSKKRKNKHSITHLKEETNSHGIDLLGLETLAEVAANTQKIDEVGITLQ